MLSDKLPSPKNLAEYEVANKKPYVVEALRLGEFENIPKYQKLASSIHDFIMSEIQVKNLEESFESYQSILRGLYSQIFYQEGEKPEYTTERLSKWIQKVIIPQRKIQAIKSKLSNAVT